MYIYIYIYIYIYMCVCVSVYICKYVSIRHPYAQPGQRDHSRPQRCRM